MQEREEVHRGRGGIARVVATAAILISLGIAGPAGACSDVPFSILAWASNGRAPRCFDFPLPHAQDNAAGAFCSCSNPYMLEDLTASVLGAGVSTRGRGVWVRWFHLGHPLYREDRLACSIGSRLPVRSFSLRIAPVVERREVKGYPARTCRALSCSLGYERDRSLAIEVRCTPFDDEPGVRREASFSCAIRTDAFSAVLQRVVAGEERGYTGLWCAAQLHGNVTLFSEYRSPADELGCGVAARIRSFLFGLSWCYHPALGATASAGFGRWWAW